MGKRSSSAKQRVADYLLSIHFGVASGPIDAIRKIWVAEKVAWEGNLTTQGPISINRPELFGGAQKEGGVVGSAYWLPGRTDQVLNDELAFKIGGGPTSVPAYRGLGSIWFTGFGGFGGFKWSTNNPIIQSVWATVSRAPKCVGMDANIAMIGDNANPAHIIFECLTNTDWGMGAPTNTINVTSFNAAAQTLANEGFGLSMIWARQAEIESFVNEVLDHIQAMVFQNPLDGLLTIKLLRDDYNPETVREVNADNAKMGGFERKMWGETTNEIAVTWTNPENEQEEVLILQDIANVSIQGSSAQSSVNYYGVRTKELAERLAARELRQRAYPLATCDMELDRTWWGIVPGDVVKINWPERRLNDVFMRVHDVDYGRPGQSTISAKLVEDIYALNRIRAYIPPVSQAPIIAEQPRDVDNAVVLTFPAYWLPQADLGNVSDYDPTESVVGIIAWHDSADSYGFDLLTEQVDTVGNVTWRNDGSRSFVGVGNITAGLAATATSVLPALPSANGTPPAEGGWVIIGTNEATQELCLVGPRVTNGWTIYRGYLDTVPKAWPNGTPIRYLPTPLLRADSQNVRAVGEIADYKLLTRTSLGVLDEAAATVRSGTATNRMHRPLRPANVSINGVAIGGTVNVSSDPNITITWANRNRLVEEVSAPLWTAGPETPEYQQRTVIRVLATNNTLIREYTHLWTENSFTIPKAWFAQYATLIVRVLSERAGLESLQFSEFTITGLPNNPSADPPPPPPVAGDPPSPVANPDANDWTLEGGVIGLSDGSTLPAITLVGDPGDALAEYGLTRYRIATGSNSSAFWDDAAVWDDSFIWFDDPPEGTPQNWLLGARFDVRPGMIYVPVGPVAPNVTYEVQIAYVREGVQSAWVSVGTTLTGVVSQATLDQVSGLIIQCDWTGAPLPGQSGQVKMTRRLGSTDVSSSTLWTVTSRGCTATIASDGLVTVNLAQPIADVASVTVTAVRDQITIQSTFDVSKNRAARPGDPSAPVGSLAEDPTIEGVTLNTYGPINGGPLTVRAGNAGTAQCTASLSFTTDAISRGAFGKVQWRIVGGTWADLAPEVASESPAVSFGFDFNLGLLVVSAQATGLTPNSQYEFRLLLRGDGGLESTTIWFFGNFTVDARA